METEEQLREAWLRKIRAFISSGYELCHVWENLGYADNDVTGGADNPFGMSFDEFLANVSEWAHTVKKEWAK
jgi:hypothetical protein